MITTQTPREAAFANPIYSDKRVGVCFCVMNYDEVKIIKQKDPLVMKNRYDNLPACLEDCFEFREILLKY